jgi:hypothetical protein
MTSNDCRAKALSATVVGTRKQQKWRGNLLTTFETAKSTHLNDRAHLVQALEEIT